LLKQKLKVVIAAAAAEEEASVYLPFVMVYCSSFSALMVLV